VIVALIAIINALAGYFHWYWSVWWFDMPMHFAGGFFIGMLSLYIMRRSILLAQEKGKYIRTFFIVLLSTLVMGILWEVFEFLMQGGFSGSLASPVDSLSDICFDLAGGALAIMIYLPQRKNITNESNNNVQTT